MKSGKNIIKQVRERELTDKELNRREEIADDLPDAEFKKRYGAAWKGIKMATATNMAKKEEVDLEETDIKMKDQSFDGDKDKKDFFKFMKSKFNLSLKGKIEPGKAGIQLLVIASVSLICGWAISLWKFDFPILILKSVNYKYLVVVSKHFYFRNIK